ncbi:hypothetical protein [Duganella sp. BJB476]|uniref:hypothetical protein n=1 Tax=Duganella sp. BJB476 TaxID=1871176 RepID=UPI0011C16904|nr:hypothetical protein [Duganella sp. BJB476]
MNGTDNLTSMFKNMIESVERLCKVYTTATYGPPNVGYLWQGVFLPNGTMLRAAGQRDSTQYAVVKYGELILDGAPVSFQGLCDGLLGQSHDALQKLRVQRPDDWEWVTAIDLKRQKLRGRVYRSDKPHFEL